MVLAFNVHVAAACLAVLLVVTAILCIAISLGMQSSSNNNNKLPKGVGDTGPINGKVPRNYWKASPYGECTWIPSTNCPEGQVFAGVDKSDCSPGDSKTLCAAESWEDSKTNQIWKQSACTLDDVPCKPTSSTGIAEEYNDCPLVIDDKGATTYNGTIAVCTNKCSKTTDPPC